MRKNILSTLFATTLVLSMSACSTEDIVDEILDLYPNGSANYTTTDLGGGNFSMKFDFDDLGINSYTYTINNSETDTHFVNPEGGYYTTKINDTLECIKSNEESFSCTSSDGTVRTFAPNPKLYLHKTIVEFEGDNLDKDYNDVVKYEYKLETITVNGLERYL